jgi:hypothetical protein
LCKEQIKNARVGRFFCEGDRGSIGQKPVTYSRFRDNELGFLRICFQLLAQLPYVNPQVLNVVGIRRVPHIGKDGLVGQHPARI